MAATYTYFVIKCVCMFSVLVFLVFKHTPSLCSYNIFLSTFLCLCHVEVNVNDILSNPIYYNTPTNRSRNIFFLSREDFYFQNYVNNFLLYESLIIQYTPKNYLLPNNPALSRVEQNDFFISSYMNIIFTFCKESSKFWGVKSIKKLLLHLGVI